MHKRKFITFISVMLVFMLIILTLPVNSVFAADPPGKDKKPVYKGKVTVEERLAAGKKFREAFAAAAAGKAVTKPGQSLVQPAQIQAAAVPDGHILGADGLPVPHYFGPYPNYALSPLPTVVTDALGNVTSVTGGMRKFVDALPNLYIPGVNTVADADNSLGQYIPVAVPDKLTYAEGGSGYTSAPTVTIAPPATPGGVTATATAVVAGGKVTAVNITNPGSGYTTAPAVVFSNGGGGSGAFAMATITGGQVTAINLVGSDYYEIELGQYTEQMHSDLPPTTLRGYRQTNTTDPAVSQFHYLGPVIIAQKDRPVRIKFTNNLPTGAGGDLFIPVDTTVMGAGMGWAMDAQNNPINYTQNRATLHLHGGRSPWISDGTPHQWVVPAAEYPNTPYPEGVSVYNVPDMPDPGPGSLTFFYTNQQSARLMFYHDHAFGITRLNVYAGEAAGYLIEDEVEKDLVNRGIIPADQIPLVIQDKTFVPDPNIPYSNIFGNWASQMAFYDPTWDSTKWGGFGGLWYPHVYMPVQNPYDISGINAFGRWHYGPWFWPPVTPVHPPVANPYADPNNPGYSPLEPPFMPGTPSNSMGMESFFDTPVVNGTAYPYLEVDPKAYRFRILNAANDRFWNLQLYQADPTVVTFDGRTNTEVKMVPAAATPGFPAAWPTDGREGGVPDPTMIGPQMVQIASEGGFLPAPVVLPNQPITWNQDKTTFNFGNVNGGTLILGPAERADVIVDFRDFAGKTLILYNDSPAPFPAWTPQFDYYTGAPDLTDTGGSPGTQPGFGPNTRTIMQIRVRNTAPAASYNLDALNAEFITTATKDGVFKRGQDPIIVGQSAYNAAYNITFPSTWPYWGLSGIADTTLSFQTPSGQMVSNFPMQPKAIQDEMGEAFDTEYGRMSGFLGLERPTTIAGQQNFMLYPYLSPPVEIIGTSVLGTPIGALGDGTQIWKITHNGVDTHPIHFHMFEVQLVNRVGWDNGRRLPDPNELGWKDTLRISPLEDTIVALRPVVPSFPFEIPNSIRLLDPTKPANIVLPGPPGGFKDPLGNPVTVTNHYVNFGWEYVWHCHILSHEEMDMMHGIGFAVPPAAPLNLTATRVGNGVNRRVDLRWTDNSLNETRWSIQRATTTNGPWNAIATVPTTTALTKGGAVTYSDRIGNTNQTFFYRVFASNVVGDTVTPGFPTMAPNSAFSNVASWVAATPPPAPTITSLTWAPQGTNFARVTLNWTDVAGETGYTIQGATSSDFTTGRITINVGANTTTYTVSNMPRNRTFWVRMAATNAAGTSGWSNVVSITTQ